MVQKFDLLLNLFNHVLLKSHPTLERYFFSNVSIAQFIVPTKNNITNRWNFINNKNYFLLFATVKFSNHQRTRQFVQQFIKLLIDLSIKINDCRSIRTDCRSILTTADQIVDQLVDQIINAFILKSRSPIHSVV